MIAAQPETRFEQLAARLAARARALAEARARRLALARRGDPARWRRAGLIWPLFTKD